MSRNTQKQHGTSDRKDEVTSKLENPTAASELASPPDPFADLSALRLGQNYQDDIAVQRVLTTIPVGKPNRQDFIRVHPDENYRLATMALELKDDREVYLVAPSMRGVLADELWPVILYLVINRAGVVRLWPVKLPGPDGKENPWHQSAREAARLAMGRWTRIAANMQLGAYEVHVANGELSEPKWPEEAFTDLLKVAFKDRFIDSPDHVVAKRLRGEV